MSDDDDDQAMSEAQEQDSDQEESEVELIETHPVVVDLTNATPTQKASSQGKGPCNDDTKVDDTDEGDTCPICLEMWADAGEHRLCAMRCGHLFGRSCIEMWLRNNKNCPSCKKRGFKRDLRNIYCNKVIALEESTVLDLKARLHQAEESQCLLQTTLNGYVVQREQLTAQVTSLQERLQAAHAQLTAQQLIGGAIAKVKEMRFQRLIRAKVVQVSSEVGCRVMDTDSWLNAIVCSMKCPSAMFGSYGLTKLNMTTFDTIGNMPLHSAPIRDVRFQSAGGSSLLVTASADKQARLVDTRAPGPARTYAAPPGTRSAPLWACCWGDPASMGGSYTIFLGEQQGDIIELDMRMLAERVSTLKVEGDMSPVMALQALPAAAGECLPGGALIACRLSSVRVFERVQGVYKLRLLNDAPQGPFMSMVVDEGSVVGVASNNRHLLLSARPNNNNAFTRHIYGQFKEDSASNLTFSPIHTLAGGSSATLLSRSAMTSDCACAYVESSRTVATWCLSTGQTLPSCHVVPQAVLDVAMISNAGKNHVLALDEQKLQVFNMD